MTEPFKSVRICFPSTGSQRDVLMPIEDNTTLNSLVTLLKTTDAVAVEAENLSVEELEFLKTSADTQGCPLFVDTGHCDDCTPKTPSCRSVRLKIKKD